MIRDGQLLTPSLREGALPGITRSVLLESADELGIPAREVRLKWEQLLAADAVFVSSSLRGISLVGEVRGLRRFRATPPIALTRLKTAYQAKIKQEIIRVS